MHAHGARLNEANWVAVSHEPDGSPCFVYRPFGTPGMRLFLWVFFLVGHRVSFHDGVPSPHAMAYHGDVRGD
jgi:hypothetical protein